VGDLLATAVEDLSARPIAAADAVLDDEAANGAARVSERRDRYQSIPDAEKWLSGILTQVRVAGRDQGDAKRLKLRELVLVRHAVEVSRSVHDSLLNVPSDAPPAGRATRRVVRMTGDLRRHGRPRRSYDSRMRRTGSKSNSPCASADISTLSLGTRTDRAIASKNGD
jgi:hypothetical protein